MKSSAKASITHLASFAALCLASWQNTARAQLQFGAVVPVGPPIRADGFDETARGISTDGLRLYLSSNRAGNSFDLYSTKRATINSAWEVPVPIAELNTANQPNTGHDEFSPTITPDEQTLLFDRDGIWMSTRPSTSAPWSSGALMPPPINLQGFPSAQSNISSDGLTMLFNSERAGRARTKRLVHGNAADHNERLERFKSRPDDQHASE
jgi:hypothetical protein